VNTNNGVKWRRFIGLVPKKVEQINDHLVSLCFAGQNIGSRSMLFVKSGFIKISNTIGVIP